ncbi:MAG: metallophosphoesterase family protein [candidate division KSB1 bacterium]|nr:metallophosphoesterase family protein [candidate division KSB1 bacterium]
MKKSQRILSRRLERHLKIIVEHLKAPAIILTPALKLTGLYERGFRNASRLRRCEFSLSFTALPPAFDGYRLLILSDLHIDTPLPLAEQIRSLTRDVPFDLALFLGDFRHKISGAHRSAAEKTKQLLADLSPRDGILAVRGNHDSPALMEELQDAGIEVLTNRHKAVRHDDQAIWILGVDDPHYDRADDLAAAASGVPADGFKILLAHTAELFREAAASGVDLYLCGHTHGGQICLRNGRPIITNVRTPRAWSYGFWHYRNMTGYTSSGVGCSSVPVRFNCPPEIVLITLRRKMSE